MKILENNFIRPYSWMNESLIAKSETKCGNGVFTKKGIKKDTLLIIFGGYVLTRKQENILPLEIRDIAIQIEKDFVIGVVDKNQLHDYDYVNHSCEPNSGIKGQISLIAMRDIKKGEEITFDYGTVLYRGKGAPAYELKCECGIKSCRGKITQHDWMLPELQAKYKDFFPYYILDEINKLKQ